jgi:7,8-dihydro-6-hydroxymethylpterin-pyrophosphokinase
MSQEMAAVVVFGALGLFALAMFVLERRGVARRKAARGGREIDVSDLVFFGGEAGEAPKTQTPRKN